MCGDGISDVLSPSEKVVGMLETVNEMIKSGVTGRGPLETIEDYLGIILMSSTSLVELVRLFSALVFTSVNVFNRLGPMFLLSASFPSSGYSNVSREGEGSRGL